MAIVLVANTNILKRDFHPTDLILSLAIQVKIRLEKMGPAPENVVTAIKTIAERSGLLVVANEDLKALGTPDFTGAYFLDAGKVMVVDHRTKTKQNLKDIGTLVLKDKQKERVATIASHLRKLASKQT